MKTTVKHTYSLVLISLISPAAEARNYEAAIKSIYADGKTIVAAIGLIMILFAAFITMTNMQAGIARYINVVVGLIMATTATVGVAYLMGAFS